MRLTIKTLDQRTFVVEFDESRTIGDLKAHLCKLPDIAVQPELQHLIYAGRVLSNENSLKSYSIDERKFLVMMAKKNGAAETAPPALKKSTDESSKLPAAAEQPKAAQAAAATEVASSAAAAASSSATAASATGKTEQQNSPKAAAAPEKQPERAEPETAGAAAAAVSTPAPAAAATDSSTAPLLARAANMAPSIHPNDALVRDIVSMGYAEDEVRRALAASYNNPDRAIEYLIDGIPNLPEMPVASGLAAPRAGQSATAAAAAAAAAAGENPLSFLRDDPRFSQMRQIIRQNPELLGSVLTKIGESNPELLTIIRQHQEEFVRMLNEGDVSHSGGGGGGGGGVGSGGAADDDADDDDGHVVRIMLTAAERQAVDRLVSLGFTRDMVLQAYIACEKNEEQTADFLFQQMDENQ